MSAPRGGVIDSAGNIYFADSGNNLIRRIDAASGAISTVVGSGTPGYTGDGSAARLAQLKSPAKVVVDAAGNLYIADTGNSVIRFVSASTGIISTIAGNGTAAYTGDSGSPTAASFNQPQGLAVDLGGHVYVADTGNNVIPRRVRQRRSLQHSHRRTRRDNHGNLDLNPGHLPHHHRSRNAGCNELLLRLRQRSKPLSGCGTRGLQPRRGTDQQSTSEAYGVPTATGQVALDLRETLQIFALSSPEYDMLRARSLKPSESSSSTACCSRVMDGSSRDHRSASAL